MSNLIVNKQNDVSTLDASEWNQFAEINNLISSAGITPDGSVLNQVAKSIANYSNASNFFIENGTVNNYTLTANNNFLAPTSYIAGMVIRFITTNANTTTTPTVNLAGLGAKNILKADGNPVIAGDVSGYVELRYNGTDFLLSPLSSALNITATNKGLTYLNNPITIANNATDADNDIDFSAGNFQFSDKSNEAVLLAMTKRLDASWVAGTNQGGLDTGSKANSTWYYCYAIHNPTSDVSDAIFSANATTPTLPSGYTKQSKALFAFKTNSSGNILNGKWYNDRSFYFNDDILEEQNGVTTGDLVLVGVPLLDLKVKLRAAVGANVAGAFPALSVGRSATNIIFIAGTTYSGADFGYGEVPINGNATIYRSITSAGAFNSQLYTIGYQLLN